MANHKRGDSFHRLASIPESFADGYFLGWTVSSQIRTKPGKLVAELTCEWVDPATTRTLSLKALDTKAWAVGAVEMDIQFTRSSDGFVLSTSTISFEIVKDITRATEA